MNVNGYQHNLIVFAGHYGHVDIMKEMLEINPDEIKEYSQLEIHYAKPQPGYDAIYTGPPGGIEITYMNIVQAASYYGKLDLLEELVDIIPNKYYFLWTTITEHLQFPPFYYKGGMSPTWFCFIRMLQTLDQEKYVEMFKILYAQLIPIAQLTFVKNEFFANEGPTFGMHPVIEYLNEHKPSATKP